MDSKEIAKRVASLRLTSSVMEDPILISEDLSSLGQKRLDSCLVAKVFSAKTVNRETFRSQMPRILQSKKAMKIEVIGENIFILDFESMVNRRYALKEGPWNFFKDLVIFKVPNGFQQAAEIVFDELPIWVQFHNLPLAYMHATILKNVGSRLGKVLEIEGSEDGSCAGKYARIQVMLDISKPLRQGIWVKQENLSEEICIILLYERLPQFCYLCGCLGHVLRDCVNSTDDPKACPFGSWLRAPSVGGLRKNQVANIKGTIRIGNNSDSSNGVSEGPKDGLILQNLNSNTLGTDSSSEKSGSDESKIFISQILTSNIAAPIQVSLIKENDSGLIMDYNDMVGKVGLNQAVKKKWKRMAKGESSSQPGLTKQLLDGDSLKRTLKNPIEAIDRNKKAKVQDCNISMEDLVSAEAAVQPCRSL